MQREIEQLLYHEARLLDDGSFPEWLNLLAPDLRYWAPVRAELFRERERDGDNNRLPLFDETKASLTLRIQRFGTGAAWIEVPTSRTRRFISNITATPDGDDAHLQVVSNFMVFKSRAFRDETMLVGCRHDRWARGASWILHERKILIDHCLVENITVLL